MNETRKLNDMVTEELTPRQKRALANERIRQLSNELSTLVQESLAFEPGELVMIPHPRGPVVMEIIEPTGKQSRYRVKTVKAGFEFDDEPFVQEGRYFEEYTPETNA